MKDDRRAFGRISELVHVETDRRDPVDAEVPRANWLTEPLHERQDEATHARIHMHVGVDFGGQRGEFGDRVDHTVRILGCRADHHDGALGDCVGHRIDIASVVVADGDNHRFEPEVVGALVKGGVGRVGQNDLAAVKIPFGSGSFAGGLDGHQDRLGASGGHESGGVGTMQKFGHRPDDVALDLPE